MDLQSLSLANMRFDPDDIGIVVIGRNEGQRLLRCLASIRSLNGRTVYVDSGSTDGSVVAARREGAEIIELDRSLPFTAARARNAGFAALIASQPNICFVQFVDGDCELADDWIVNAAAFVTQ